MSDQISRYLIHEPFFANNDEDLQVVWKAMEGVKAEGKTKSIGVSNYLRPHMEAILKTAVDPPAVIQLEYHPYLKRANDYVPWMQQQGIVVESFKRLTPVARVPDGPLVPIISRMAKDHGTTDTSIMLSWLMNRCVVVVTTTRKTERLQEYIDALQVKLSPDEIEEISTVGNTHHVRFYFPERYSKDDWS
jgi:diketogulonate reductase-like aldo/keto reductase